MKEVKKDANSRVWDEVVMAVGNVGILEDGRKG